MSKVYVTRKFTFESAHHLVGYDGACARLHGHSYKLEVTASGDIDTTCCNNVSDAMVLDFHELDRIVKENVVNIYDHMDLNKFYSIPTAELMSIGIFKIIASKLPKDTHLESVKLWETENSFAEYRGE